MSELGESEVVKRDEILSFPTGKKLKTYVLRSPGTPNPDEDTIKPIGAGGSSKVYLADQVLHGEVSIPRAIKFFMYDDGIAKLTRHRFHTPVGTDDFLNEVVNMSSVNHENLTKVTDAGVETIDKYAIPYLVSDYVDGPTLEQICTTTPNESTEAGTLLAQNTTALLELLIQIGTGLHYLHARNFTHCDIAPKNIFITLQGHQCRAIIGDLGVGRNLTKGADKVFIAGSRNYMSPEAFALRHQEVSWEVFRSLQPRWDLYSFAKTGLRVMETLQPEHKPAWWTPLFKAFNYAIAGERYHTAESMLDRLRWLLPVHREMGAVPELSSGLAGRSRKLMPVTQLVTSGRIRKLIQHPALLRLARVPQLLTSRYLYPGGVHTRYEHSLGVLETMRQYLVSLLDQPEFLEHLTASKIETALICALLCNVTRFPLYHVVDEIAHYAPEAFSQFNKQALLASALTLTDNKGRSLRDLLGMHFPAVPIQDVVNILTDNRSAFTDEDHLIHSLLNCSLDARVVDFLRRDSHHLGLASEGFKLDDILPYLTIYNHRLALRTQGMSVAEHIISLRYWMFSRVYWSNPNRSFMAMARHLIHRLSTRHEFVPELRKRLFEVSEDELLDFLKAEAGRIADGELQDLASLLCSVPQETFWVSFGASTKENPEFGVIVEKVAKMGSNDLDNLRNDLSSFLAPTLQMALKARLKKTIKEDDAETEANRIMSGKVLLLLDIPIEPGSGSKLGDDMLGIPEVGGPAMLKQLSGIIAGVNDSFLTSLRRFRVLLHPEIAPRDPKMIALVKNNITAFLMKTL